MSRAVLTPSLARGAGQQVLILAGGPDTAGLLTATQELAGYRIGLADTAAGALARLDAHRFDLLVVDITWPELPGVVRAGPP
ncbi:hypothetical protein U5640_01950 [Streptomyces sp. SS7]|uniref:hypothetical protein n=1 Tax=Streptomyces sp. SS7 TaxID=3108485 RepID=UPI0030EBE9E0